MPIIKSAKKRVRTIARQSIENARTKKNVRTAMKAFQTAIADGKKVEESQRVVQSTLDTAVKKNVLSKKRASRIGSRINAEAKKANGGKRASVKKPVAKKSTAKKPAAKKSTTKKTTKKS